MSRCRSGGEVAAGAPALLTPEDLAARYAVAKCTVLEWYHKGIIPAEVAVGKVYRFDAAAVAKALRARTRTEQAAGEMGGRSGRSGRMGRIGVI